MIASCRVLSLAQHNLPGLDFHLVIFLVLAESTSIMEASKSLLIAKMKEVLPNYCIPDQVEVLEQLPINEHGKLPIVFDIRCMCNTNFFLLSLSNLYLAGGCNWPRPQTSPDIFSMYTFQHATLKG